MLFAKLNNWFLYPKRLNISLSENDSFLKHIYCIWQYYCYILLFNFIDDHNNCEKLNKSDCKVKHRCALTVAYIVNLININIIEQIKPFFFYRSFREAMQLSRGLAKLSLKTPVSLILYLTCVFVLQDSTKTEKSRACTKRTSECRIIQNS